MVNLPLAGIYSDSNLLDATFCTSLKKIIKLQKKTEKEYGKFIGSSESGKIYGRNCFAFGCKSAIKDVQRKNSNIFVLVTVPALPGKVERGPRKKRITQKMINEMDGRLEWQNAISDLGRKNYRNLRNVLKDPQTLQESVL